VIEAARDTWFMVGRQTRNLMREPIWIALILIQPLVWLLLYGQLFKRITHLPGGGFGGVSYITFLAPAIVVMNAFFGATWSGMAMITDLDRDVIPRFLATPVSRVALVASQVVRSSLTAMIQALIILLIALALGVRIHTGIVGWLVILAAAALVSSAFAGL
jgi:ABC-2 type transport system permease protein